jgi:hypothetical protein
MRASTRPKSNFVSLLEAFNLIGRRMMGSDWDGSESGAIRYGQRTKVDPAIRKRGLTVLSVLRELVTDGSLPLIYTDEQRRRVPYYENTGFWMTALYPDPNGTGEGLIELDDRYMHHCVVSIATLAKRMPRPSSTRRPGPTSDFTSFEAAIEDFFNSNSIKASNPCVWQHAKQVLAGCGKWPSKSWGNDLINKGRERHEKRGRRLQLRSTPDGPL